MGGQGVCVRRLGGDRAGEIGLTRFLRNGKVTVEAMVAEAARRTAERCQGRPVLALQDTTVVQSAGGGGLYLHAVLAVDAADGAILGLVHAEFLTRCAGQRGSRRARPIADKESRRWLTGNAQVAQVCAGARRITSICDREADIYEAFAGRPATTDLVVRAAQDRSLGDGGRLFARVDALPVAAQARLDLPAKPGRRARATVVAVRFMTAQLKRPQNGVTKGLPKSVEVNFVDVREIAPPDDEAAVHWRLITTLAVSNPAEAFAVVDLYRRRWALEQLFRTMKAQGFDVEALRMGEAGARRNLIAATLVAAVTIQQLVHVRDGAPGPIRPMLDAFEPEDQPLVEAFCAQLEGKTERQKNPHPKGSLAYAAWVCARLGGWTGYYGKPGPIVMLRGWLHFQAAKHGITVLAAYQDV